MYSVANHDRVGGICIEEHIGVVCIYAWTVAALIEVLSHGVGHEVDGIPTR